jgi:hypothetical protein
MSPDGNIALDFYAVLDEKAPTFGVLSQAVFLPEGSIDIGAFQCREFFEAVMARDGSARGEAMTFRGQSVPAYHRN